MKPRSIRLRLLLAAAASVAVALAIAALGLLFLFERHVERRAESELATDLNQIVAAAEFNADGRLVMTSPPANPLYATPLSGRYWQIDVPASGEVLRSRSLWDFKLAPPVDAPADGARHSREITGPGDSLLVAVERTIVDDAGNSFRVTVAEDHQSIANAVGDYATELVPALAILAVFLVAAMWVQVRVGLAPLEPLRAALARVVSGQTGRLEADVPSEIQPLADEINRLLDAQKRALARARSRATDLAHGLKTPLQVLSADIRSLRDKGEAQLADEIERSAGAIRHHVERELVRARVAPSGSAQTQSRVAEAAENVIAVLKRTPQGERLRFSVDVSPDFEVPMDAGDLVEVLGNLIENAARFAKSSVRVEAGETVEAVLVTVSDDGPGIPAEKKDAAVSRGVSLDDRTGQTGLGLAIVSDVLDTYGGTLSLSDAQPGLRAGITLPRARLPRPTSNV